MISLIRRRLLAAAAALPVLPAFAQTRALTCGELTAAQTEGPFFKTNTPRRVSLIEGSSRAPRLVVTGQVLSARCQPVANALLDFWHADEDGEYDNQGFRYRGHQFSDAEGAYRLETIVPAEYPGRRPTGVPRVPCRGACSIPAPPDVAALGLAGGSGRPRTAPPAA